MALPAWMFLGARASCPQRAEGTGLAFTVSPGWGAQVSQEAGLMDGLGEDVTAASTSPHAYLDGRVSWGTRIGGLVAPREALRPWAEHDGDVTQRLVYP